MGAATHEGRTFAKDLIAHFRLAETQQTTGTIDLTAKF